MGDVREAIVSLMEKKGLNQSKLSKLSGVSKSSLSRYINGDEMPVSALQAIAYALGCTTDEILGLSTMQITVDEQELIDLYRSMNTDQRAAIMYVARVMH